MEPPDRPRDDPSEAVDALPLVGDAPAAVGGVPAGGDGAGGRPAVGGARPVRDGRPAGQPLVLRVFATPQFFHLWLAQAISSLGDWLGFLGILILAGRLGAGAPGASVGLVMAARIVPGFFLSAGAGVLIDRMDRRQVMVVTMAVRAGVVATLPFVNSVLGLVLASLVLELATLFFGPAKEALVPNVVPPDKLTTANSLGLAAAYGTFPLGAGVFAVLAEVAEWLGSIEALDSLRTSQEAVAFYATVVCYIVSAVLIYRLRVAQAHLPAAEARTRDGNGADHPLVDLGQVVREIKEGWHYAFINPVVRAVNVGLACGLIGGGMLVPLGQAFSDEVLHAGPSGFGTFVFAMGVGVAAGVVALSALQNRVPKVRTFVTSVWAAGVVLFVGASTSELWAAVVCVAVVGVCAGSVYVLGFTLLHENVDDELRGRIFSALYTLVRFCVLLSMALGPVLADVFDGLSDRLVDGRIDVGVGEIAVPGVRITLWLAGVIMVVAGVLSGLSLRTLRSSRAEVHA